MAGIVYDSLGKIAVLGETVGESVMERLRDIPIVD
jgi:hypothetical protein